MIGSLENDLGAASRVEVQLCFIEGGVHVKDGDGYYWTE
jgi:hypothetical protein